MGGLCRGAHEITGIHTPLFLYGWVIGGFVGWPGGWWCGGWVGGGMLVGGGVGGVLVRVGWWVYYTLISVEKKIRKSSGLQLRF